MKGTVTTRTNQAKKRSLDCCHRCGGLMLSELSGDTGAVESRCVTCGERVDQVILAHRQHHRARPEVEESFAGGWHSRVNG
ncbi:MAG: hypothetical protein Q8L74_08825 [Nitrospirota bacterium]|nr:hypothetical protein [Nitrospirota bacterium]MDP2382064.1 hypothetical protein [Nitrospirota bacterium]MDP3599359.1 hypothetical protein [Nitrospirota bacterium]